jgi:hypothetical protein
VYLLFDYAFAEEEGIVYREIDPEDKRIKRLSDYILPIKAGS